MCLFQLFLRSKPGSHLLFLPFFSDVLCFEHSILNGDSDEFQAILRYLFSGFSSAVNKIVSDHKYNVAFKKEGTPLMAEVYRILRKGLDYAPALSIDQFLSPGFAFRKITMLNEIIHILIELDSESSEKKQRRKTHWDRRIEHSRKRDAERREEEFQKNDIQSYGPPPTHHAQPVVQRHSRDEEVNDEDDEAKSDITESVEERSYIEEDVYVLQSGVYKQR